MPEQNDSLHLLSAIVERVNVGIFAVNKDLQVLLWNGFMAVNSRLSANQVVGRGLFDVFPDLPRRWLERKIKNVFILRNFAFTSWELRPYLFEFPHNRPVTGPGVCMRQDCTFTPIMGEDGEVESVCITIFDVTDTSIYQEGMRDALARLAEASSRDGLTGLHNRGYAEERLAQEVAKTKRYGGKLSLLLLDIDFFKKINDTFGHLGGDEILREFARRVSQCVRETDTLGRYGGEEFVVILPNTGVGGARILADRILQAVSASPFAYREGSIPVTLSIGVAEMRAQCENHEELIHHADTALYQAKVTGRNRVVECTDDETPAVSVA